MCRTASTSCARRRTTTSASSARLPGRRRSGAGRRGDPCTASASTRWPRRRGRAPTHIVDMSAACRSRRSAPQDASCFELVHELVEEEPADALDPETLGLLASIGIARAPRSRPTSGCAEILAEAAVVGAATARATAYRTPARGGVPVSRTAPGARRSSAAATSSSRTTPGCSTRARSCTSTRSASRRRWPSGTSASGPCARRPSSMPREQRLDGGRRYRLHLPPASRRSSSGRSSSTTRRRVDAADRPALPEHGLQQARRLPSATMAPSRSSSGRVRPEAGWPANWLQTIAGEGVEHDPAPVWPAPAVLRRDRGGRRRSCRSTSSDRAVPEAAPSARRRGGETRHRRYCRSMLAATTTAATLSRRARRHRPDRDRADRRGAGAAPAAVPRARLHGARGGRVRSQAAPGAELRRPVRRQGGDRQGARPRRAVHVDRDRDRRPRQAAGLPERIDAGGRRPARRRPRRPVDDALQTTSRRSRDRARSRASTRASAATALASRDGASCASPCASCGPRATMAAAFDFLRAAVFGCSTRFAPALSISRTSATCSAATASASPPSTAVWRRRK